MPNGTATQTTTPACAEHTELFQHRLLEEPPAASSMSADERRQMASMQARAERLCASCPLQSACLYDAVVKFDVAGFVAGTTHRQRNELRSRLGVRVQPEDLDTLAGVIAPNRQVDHDEVLRLRRANPDESLETIAHRLGCSLSTVKRHLRKARSQATTKPATRRVHTPEQVWRAYTEGRTHGRVHAA